jgi:hypothetical protein
VAKGRTAGDLTPPVRLTAGGQPIAVDSPGHSAPFVGDIDGDGKRDLLVGQFKDGLLWIYRNVGTNRHPRFAKCELLLDGQAEGRVPSGCCVGFTPQLVDLDGDGKLDILSGSWPGELYFFRGQGKGRFAPGEILKGKDGKPLKVDNASTVFAADWRGRGVLDLLVGSIQGHVYLVPNEGTARKYAFGKPRKLKVGGQEIRLPHGDSHPVAADWDGDGKLDLIVGAGDGSVLWYRNIGSAKEPKLDAARTLVRPGTLHYAATPGAPPPYGIRAKVCVVDWDGDGKLDLLVGDLSQYLPDKCRMTEAEKKAVATAREKLPALRRAYEQTAQEYAAADRIAEDPQARAQRLARLRQARQKYELAGQKVQDAQDALERLERLAWARRSEAVKKAEAAARKEMEAARQAYLDYREKEYNPLFQVPPGETSAEARARREKIEAVRQTMQKLFHRWQQALAAHQKLDRPDLNRLTAAEKEELAATWKKLADLRKARQEIYTRECVPLYQPVETPAAAKARQARLEKIRRKYDQAVRAYQDALEIARKYEQPQTTGSVWLFLRKADRGKAARN